jgi:hypothetical protein
MIIRRVSDLGGDHGAPGLVTAPPRGFTEPKGARMSKTDKTRPRWVRMAETPGLTSVPVHDHRFGPCTLPDAISAGAVTASTPRGRCYWAGGGYHVLKCDGGSCSRERQVWRRKANRLDRYRVRRELRAYHDED